MMKRPGFPAWAASLFLAAAFVAGVAWFSGPAAVVAAVAAFLWIAWRHDTDLGSCLPLAVLVVIAAGVLALMLVLMSVRQ